MTGAAGEGAPGPAELFAQLPVAALLIDPAGCVAQANAEAEALLNMSERAMRGARLAAIVTPPPHEGNPRAFAAFDAELVTARGGRVRADFLEAALSERPGWRLITLHAAASSRRIGATGERAASRAAIGAAAMLAHEIKNPLSGIRGAAQLLARDGDAELTGLITREVDRIAALIDRMQAFTDPRALPLEPANIYPLIDHARRVALAGFANGIAIEERFDPSLPAAMVNPDAFLQVMLNLLKNAAEASGALKQPQLRITTAYRHGMALGTAPGRARTPLPIEICVVDNGAGAPPEIAGQLFDPFVSGKPEGQGLGLALVDKLVRDMGGIVQYAREGLPEMTVFRILLARAPA